MQTHGELFFSALELTTIAELGPLAKTLDVPVPTHGLLITDGQSVHLPADQGFAGESFKKQIWDALSYYGSYDLAYLLRGLRGVDYPEIVRDVCTKAKVPGAPLAGDTLEAVTTNELSLIQRYFDEIWALMSDEEKQELLGAMDLGPGAVGLGGPMLAAAIVAGKLGGFATYRLTAVVAGFVVRALLGTGLRFGAMGTVMQALSVILGPVGWIASGAWLAKDLMSPAFRKTLPAVVIVAALRQLTLQRDVIGVMGAGSTGKDSLLKYVFGVDTGGIHPIPGATTGVRTYPLPPPSLARVVNFPGFGDLRDEVERQLADQIKNCNLAIYIVKNSDVVQRAEVEHFHRVQSFARHMIVVFNFCDKLDEEEFERTTNENKKRLGVADPVLTSLKPGRTAAGSLFHHGVREIKGRVNAWAVHERKKAPVFVEES